MLDEIAPRRTSIAVEHLPQMWTNEAKGGGAEGAGSVAAEFVDKLRRSVENKANALFSITENGVSSQGGGDVHNRARNSSNSTESPTPRCSAVVFADSFTTPMTMRQQQRGEANSKKDTNSPSKVHLALDSDGKATGNDRSVAEADSVEWPGVEANLSPQSRFSELPGTVLAPNRVGSFITEEMKSLPTLLKSGDEED